MSGKKFSTEKKGEKPSTAKKVSKGNDEEEVATGMGTGLFEDYEDEDIKVGPAAGEPFAQGLAYTLGIGQGDLKSPQEVTTSSLVQIKPIVPIKKKLAASFGSITSKDPKDRKSLFLSYFANKTSGNPLLGANMRLTGDITKDMSDYSIPSTNEGHVFLGMAYVVALSGLASARCDVGTFDELTITVRFPKNFNPEKDSTGAVLRGGENGEISSYPIGRYSDEEQGSYDVNNISLCPDSEERGVFNLIHNGETDYMQMYIDLLAAFQVAPLKAQHINSYFSMKRTYTINGDYIATNFEKLTGGAPNIAGDDDLRALVSENEWMKYRLTFATITGVVERFLDDLHSDFHFLVSEPTRQIVKEASAKPHDEALFRKIPTTLLAYAYQWTIVCDLGIIGLYSGKRAFEGLSTTQQKSMINILNEAKMKVKVWEKTLMKGYEAIEDSLKNI